MLYVTLSYLLDDNCTVNTDQEIFFKISCSRALISNGLSGRSPRLITAPAVLPSGAGDNYASQSSSPVYSVHETVVQPAVQYPAAPAYPPPPLENVPDINFDSCNCKFGKLGKFLS